MLRITGGTLRGRRISAPRGRGTRPTQEKARQGLFNTLSNLADLDGAVVWDLFAGSGALGIEALSRGAARAVFLESHGPTAAAIRTTLKQLNIPPEACQVVVRRVENWLAQAAGEPFPAVVLLDPPYQTGLSEKALAGIAACPAVPQGCLVVLECATREEPPAPPGLVPLRAKRYGDTQILFLEKAAGTPQGPTEVKE